MYLDLPFIAVGKRLVDGECAVSRLLDFYFILFYFHKEIWLSHTNYRSKINCKHKFEKLGFIIVWISYCISFNSGNLIIYIYIHKISIVLGLN